MSLVWAVQSNLINSSDLARLELACRAQAVPFCPFQTVPFSDALPDIPHDRPTVFYGATRCMSSIYRDGRWTPGVFF